MNRIEHTCELHKNSGLNCAQALLTAFGKAFGIDPNMARDLGRPLGAGTAHTGNSCGYVTAAVLILSLANKRSDELSSRKAAHGPITDFIQQFKSLHGHFRCKDLLGADMSTPEGVKRIKNEKLIAKYCYVFGYDVATILEDLLISP